MSDSHSMEVHLTPGGYERGVARPSDAVETWLRESEQSSGYAPPMVDWRLVWTSNAVSAGELAVLRAKFPHPQIADQEREERELRLNSELRTWKRRRHTATVS
jgi:hypothetical protein